MIATNLNQSNRLNKLLNAGISQKHIDILNKFAALRGEVLKGVASIRGIEKKGCPSDDFVGEPHLMHSLARGVYVPKGNKFALSIQLTEKTENYGKEIIYLSPSKWEIKYRPPTAKNPNSSRAKFDTQALKNCHDQNIPIGVLWSVQGGVNRVLGLGAIKDIENGNFIIIPENLGSKQKAKMAITSYIDKKMMAGDFSAPDAQTTALARIGQERFRKQLLPIYGNCCAFCGLDAEELLIASHIVPWKYDKQNRLNPRNGLLLCRLCDYAFEIGQIMLTPDLQIIQSAKLISNKINPAVNSWLSNIGERVRLKESENAPDPSFIGKKNSLLQEKLYPALG